VLSLAVVCDLSLEGQVRVLGIVAVDLVHITVCLVLCYWFQWRVLFRCFKTKNVLSFVKEKKSVSKHVHVLFFCSVQCQF